MTLWYQQETSSKVSLSNFRKKHFWDTLMCMLFVAQFRERLTNVKFFSVVSLIYLRSESVYFTAYVLSFPNYEYFNVRIKIRLKYKASIIYTLR